MPISRNDVRVQCPFYQYDECTNNNMIKRIICEGLVPDSNLVLYYKFKRDYHIQLDTFCCRYFDRCEVYRMLMEKYEQM